MKHEEWRKAIQEQIAIDTEYISSFQTTITILAEILEERDRVRDEYIKDGARPVIDFTTDRGAVNKKPNPLLRQWQDLNASALNYLRDLGITPQGMRKLQGTLPKPEKRAGGKLSLLEQMLNDECEEEEAEP